MTARCRVVEEERLAEQVELDSRKYLQKQPHVCTERMRLAAPQVTHMGRARLPRCMFLRDMHSTL